MPFYYTVVRAMPNADKVIKKRSGYSSVDNAGSFTAFQGMRDGQ